MSLGAVFYLGICATMIAYAVWGRLLQTYPPGTIAPFALLAPCTGVLAAALVLDEVFSPLRYVGMSLILSGLAVVLRPGSEPVSAA